MLQAGAVARSMDAATARRDAEVRVGHLMVAGWYLKNHPVSGTAIDERVYEGQTYYVWSREYHGFDEWGEGKQGYAEAKELGLDVLEKVCSVNEEGAPIDVIGHWEGPCLRDPDGRPVMLDGSTPTSMVVTEPSLLSRFAGFLSWLCTQVRRERDVTGAYPFEVSSSSSS